MSVTHETPDQPDVISLIKELDDYQDTLYPPEARYALDLNSLKASNIIFVVARDHVGRAVGCGALVLESGRGELKRMYVQPASRGKGIAQEILASLEAAAAKRGCVDLKLETGPRQPEALRFYGKQGYKTCGPFGSYPEHPLSVFMEKTLAQRHSET